MGFGIFLFLKQIVDMFYKWQILDYGMVVFAFGLLVYGLLKDKTYLKIKTNIKLPDILIIGVELAYFWCFLKDNAGYVVFFKISSAILLYFLGRIYHRKTLNYGYWLCMAGYITVYTNMIVRLKHWQWHPFHLYVWDGGMYYYKTDLAVGITIAVIFIFFFAKNKFLKWITILPIGSYMVFYSSARMEWPVFSIIYVCFAIYVIKEYRKKTEYSKKPYKVFNYLYCIVIALILIGIQFFDFDKYEELIHATESWDSWVEKLFHARQIYTFDIFHYMSEQSFWVRLTGVDITNIYLHNIKGDRSHSEYLQTFYSLGYLGVIMMVGFWITVISTVSKVKDTKIRRMTTLLIIFFLITGLTIEVFESTQMSWFVLLFAGVAITEESRQQL